MFPWFYTVNHIDHLLRSQKNSLLQNGYPKGVINYNVNDLLHKHQNKPSQPTLTVPKKDVTLVLPYLGLHSDAITRRLKSCVNKFYGFVNLRVVFQNTRRIKSFFPYKDRFNRLNTLTDTKTAFRTLKGTATTPVIFIWESPRDDSNLVPRLSLLCRQRRESLGTRLVGQR